MFKSARYLLLLSIIFSFLNIHPSVAFNSTAWQDKVDPALLNNDQPQVEFILFLSEQADTTGSAKFATKQQKGEYVFQTLTQTAQRSQKPLLDLLARSSAEYRAYWIANMIWVRGDPALVETFARRQDIAKVFANPQVKMDFPEPENLINPKLLDEEGWIEWNILKVRADQVWESGYTGQGIVIGGQDTGYFWEHPALKEKYRGWNGISADHNYNWHDAIHTNISSNTCGVDTLEPCDDQQHGTHTMGTMVGDDGTYQIGMAPGARWIGCRNMDEGIGSPETYTECYQWFVAPTDLNGENPRPDLAPDVINNSWSCPTTEGCTWDSLLTVVQNVRAAGIVTVHSAGNSGPSCETVNAPGGIYDESFTVGNTDSNDNIASNSSRGPVKVDGSNRLKPDISAPGTSIRSSVPYTYSISGYTYLSGTSMAAPHVAGLVALLLSARPELKGNVDMIEWLITSSAIPRTSSQDCGGDGDLVPNNVYGWGRIDAWNAVQSALNTSFFYIPFIVKNQ